MSDSSNGSNNSEIDIVNNKDIMIENLLLLDDKSFRFSPDTRFNEETRYRSEEAETSFGDSRGPGGRDTDPSGRATGPSGRATGPSSSGAVPFGTPTPVGSGAAKRDAATPGDSVATPGDSVASVKSQKESESVKSQKQIEFENLAQQMINHNESTNVVLYSIKETFDVLENINLDFKFIYEYTKILNFNFETKYLSEDYNTQRFYTLLKYEISLREKYDENYKNIISAENKKLIQTIFNNFYKHNYHNQIEEYFFMQRILKNNKIKKEKLTKKFKSLYPTDTIYNIIFKFIILSFTIFISFMILSAINIYNNIDIIETKYIYLGFLVSIGIIIMFILFNMYNKKENVFKKKNKLYIFVLVFIFMFFLFMEVSGINSLLSNTKKLNSTDLDNLNFLDKLNYYKNNDPFFKLITNILVILVLILVMYNLGKIIKFSNMCPYIIQHDKLGLNIQVIIITILLFIIVYIYFIYRFNNLNYSLLISSVFISILSTLYYSGLKTGYLLEDKGIDFSYFFKNLFKINLEPINIEPLYGHFDFFNLNILCNDDLNIAYTYFYLNQNYFNIIIENMIINKKSDYLIKIINFIYETISNPNWSPHDENINLLCNIILYLFKQTNTDDYLPYLYIINKINTSIIKFCLNNSPKFVDFYKYAKLNIHIRNIISKIK